MLANNVLGKPFLKWAGGKTQLLEAIVKRIPSKFFNESFTYVEPFVGSGAMLFYMLQNFPLKRALINDINSDLINAYRVIQSDPYPLIARLQEFQETFWGLSEEPQQKNYYDVQRKRFNLRQEGEIEQAAMLIFLNKTCFNGLYRVNRQNAFNVPMGRYKHPKISDAENLLALHQLLKKVEILNADYQQVLQHLTPEENCLFYFDPPYKPLSETSSFNTYTQDKFCDEEQIRLARFCQKIDEMGYQWILSNSDLKNTDLSNEFFDELYQNYDVQRVMAKRAINTKASQRGALTELLISNC